MDLNLGFGLGLAHLRHPRFLSICPSRRRLGVIGRSATCDSIFADGFFHVGSGGSINGGGGTGHDCEKNSFDILHLGSKC